MALKLWHCAGSRSIRPLWTLLEMGLDFELETMLFPPRFVHPGYTELNPIGTVPFFTDSSDPDSSGEHDRIHRLSVSIWRINTVPQIWRYCPASLPMVTISIGCTAAMRP